MNHFLKITTSSLLLCTSTFSLSYAAQYPLPEITRVMFHVDKLALDKDRIKGAVADLVILASVNGQGDQARLNTNARLLAIGMRLDSKNEEIRKLNDSFRSDRHVIEANEDKYKKSLDRILYLVNVLSKAGKGTEAELFADYLKDSLIGIADDNVAMQGHVLSKQRWKNVVPEIVEEVGPAPTVVEKEEVAELMANKEGAEDVAVVEQPETTEVAGASWHFLNSSITTPIMLSQMVDLKLVNYWEVSEFQLTWKPVGGEENRVNLKFNHGIDLSKEMGLEQRVTQALVKKWKRFPSVEVSVRLPSNVSRAGGKLEDLPILTQLYASLAGKSIPAGVQVMGGVNVNGEVYREEQFWLQLKKLREERDLQKTLFCPKSTEKDLTQLIALEEPEFFVRNEVILVSDLDEITEYLGEISDENLKLAHEEFVNIRDQIGSRTVGGFSVNKEIRASLEKILELNPNHLSAKMILLRGDAKRSLKLDSYYVAEEFIPLLKSLEPVSRRAPASFTPEGMLSKVEEMDNQMGAVERYIDSADSDFVDSLNRMKTELKNLARTAKKKDSEYHVRSALTAHEQFCESYEAAEAYIKEKKEGK